MHFTQEQLIKACKHYDLSAQKALYDQYNGVLRALVRRYITNADDAKDILQEAFLLIFKNINQYKEQGSFEGWIKRIAINTALQFLKRQKKNLATTNIDHIDLSDNDADTADETPLSDFERAAQANLSETDLLQMVQALPDDFRQVFNLSVIDQFSHADIAQLLNIDETTSRTRLARAKKKIQILLKQHCQQTIQEQKSKQYQ